MDPRGVHKLAHHWWFGAVHAAVTRELRPVPGERVLDVGAGTGGLAARIRARGATVICADPDAASLAVARQRLPGQGAEFAEAAAGNLPLPDSSVDGTVACLSAHHWPDRDAGFREIARVLRPGGRLVIAEFRPAGPVRSVIRKLGGGKHTGAADAATWTRSLAHAGFSGARVIRAGWASWLVLIIRAERQVPRASTERSRP
jgi:ubiquinone/menaquinone biosynthesis C-methylase UbiE